MPLTNEIAQYQYDRTDPHYTSSLMEVAATEVLTAGSVKAAVRKARKLARQARSTEAKAYFAELASTMEG